MKKTILFLVLFLLIGASGIFFWLKFKSSTTAQISGAVIEPLSLPVQANGFEHEDLIRQAVLENKSTNNFSSTPIGITSHHLPTAATFIAQFYNSLKPIDSQNQTFIIIGPDHFEGCNNAASTTKRTYSTPFGTINSNQQMIEDLKKNGNLAEVDSCFDGEHSIGVQATFVKSLYPDSTIVPIVFSASATDNDVEQVAKAISKYQDKINVIVSVDFSHYQSTGVANQLDADSAKMIERFDGNGLTLRHMDSPPSIKSAIALAKLWNLKPQLMRHANSEEFTGISENTTGYWNIIFTP